MKKQFGTFLPIVISAILLILAMPGSGGFWPLTFIALVPYFFSCASQKNIFKTALLFSLIYYSSQLYWISSVLNQYGGLPLIVGVIAVVFLACFMGLYFLVFSYGFRFSQKFLHPALALWFIPALWVGLDWLRSYLFTGFPWMDLGYGLAAESKLIQIADVFGHHGLTFLIIQINLILFFGLQYWKDNKRPDRAIYISAVFSLIVVIAAGLYSGSQWIDWRKKIANGDKVGIGVVQGNIDQSLKWSANSLASSLNKYFRLTHSLWQSKKQPPKVVIWPETALPFYPQTSEYSRYLKQSASRYNYTLLTGAPWFEGDNDEQRSFYNSAQIMDSKGDFVNSYYKTHLVPFGEYVPFREYLSFISPLVESVGQMSPGEIKDPLEIGAMKIGVLICFESVFPDLARKWTENGSNILVNLTNDAWYGRSNAPYHTLAMTTLRAVENRKSIVRSANTGISAFISPRGEIELQSPLFEEWAQARSVGLFSGPTIFVDWGYLFAPICFIFSVLMIFLIGFQNNLFFNRNK